MRITTMYTTHQKFSTTTMLMVCLAVISMCVNQGHSFTTAPITTQRQQSSLGLMLGPDIEAQVLTTMAHVTMDFPGMMKPNKKETTPTTTTTESAARVPSQTVVLPFLLVVGRVMVIASDYILDHSIHPEELLIQLFLMSASMKDILLILTTNNSN